MSFRFLLLLLLVTGSASAQLFNSVKEYRFVNDYNLALTTYDKPDAKSKTDDKVIPGRPSMRLLDVDSVCLAPINFSDNKQVWIVEFVPGICNSTGYYTVRNKAKGNYLTVLGYEETVTLSTLRQAGNRIVLTPLKRKGANDINSSQKWRFANLQDLFAVNGYFTPNYPAPFMGRTEIVSLKNHVYDLCNISTFSFDLTYKQLGTNVGITTQLLSSALPPSYDNSKFKIIPNNPVSFVTLKNVPVFRCPKVVLRGDREFDGRINMDLRIELELNAQRNAIMLRVKFRAEEPKGDFTTTELSWAEKVYDAPSGMKIKSIVSNPLWHQAVSHNLNEQSFIQMPSEFLRYCEVVGDTMGDDISTDDNCNDDTRIGNFVFNKVAVIFE